MRGRWTGPALALAMVAGCRSAEPPRSRVEIVAAPEAEEVQVTVQHELTRAKGDGRDLIVYVGAKWCDPCTRFHDAAAAGELDGAFPNLRLLEFDLDRDRERLDRAGYGSKMIPLFALPLADGRGSGEQIEGSIKGAGAVGEITPKLRGPLDRRRR